jgi:hypothetical protein
MSTLSRAPLAFVDKTVAEMVERIARETAAMPNRLAWPEILAKIRATRRTARRANVLRPLVWAARKRNAATRRQAKSGGSP